MIEFIRCLFCNTGFIKKKHNQKFCCLRCRDKHKALVESKKCKLERLKKPSIDFRYSGYYE